MSDEPKVSQDEFLAQPEEEEKLYTGNDVAKIFRVSTKTVLRWSKPGGEFEQRNVQVLTTIGGHRRYFIEEIHQLFQLMLEGKLYDDNDGIKRSKAAGPSRIVGLPKPTASDSRS